MVNSESIVGNKCFPALYIYIYIYLQFLVVLVRARRQAIPEETQAHAYPNSSINKCHLNTFDPNKS